LAALLAVFGVGQIAGLAVGEQHEQLPEIVAVVELRKAALLRGPAEAVEGTQGDIFLVGGAAGARRPTWRVPAPPACGSSFPTRAGWRPARRP
jgi:hypothetical protein